jgi:hypothetical protein
MVVINAARNAKSGLKYPRRPCGRIRPIAHLAAMLRHSELIGEVSLAVLYGPDIPH